MDRLQDNVRAIEVNTIRHREKLQQLRGSTHVYVLKTSYVPIVSIPEQVSNEWHPHFKHLAICGSISRVDSTQ